MEELSAFELMFWSSVMARPNLSLYQVVLFFECIAMFCKRKGSAEKVEHRIWAQNLLSGGIHSFC